ncbi:MAG TPA: S-layer homology domain-containing protein [Sedimentibacter sp.]|mgnify:FL=1|nr:S-layer homology domain-containing protein [Sedimentibacter sp.]
MNKEGKDCKPSTVKRSMAIVLTLMMIISTLLGSGNLVYAVGNGEMVLKSVNHDEAVKEAVIDGNIITLTVPYGYSGEILDLSDMTYELKDGFRNQGIEFPSGDEAEIDGTTVEMEVRYTYEEGEDTETVFSTSYYVEVTSGQAPTFSGPISMTTTINEDIKFKSSDFTSYYDKNDGAEMGFISINTASIAVGELEYNGSAYEAGSRIKVSDIGKLIFKPTNIGKASFAVTAFANDDAETDCGYATLNIEVTYPAASDIKLSTNQDTVLKLSSTPFVNACNKTIGGTFDYISFDTLSSNGKIYINYVSSTNVGTLVQTGKNYSKSDLDKMTFVPNSGYFGKVNLQYKGYNTAGDVFTGKVEITVAEKVVVIEKIKYSLYVNTVVEFDADDFKEVCLDGTGQKLNYVKFTLPSSSKGTLYLNYGLSGQAKVSSSSKYYDDDIDDISFVPYKNYSGTVAIEYTGYNNKGVSYTGVIEIQVIKIEADADDITYKTGSYTPIDFDADDFDDECRDVTGKRLDYVKFTPPSSTYGTLYYNYKAKNQSKVSSSTKYYDDELDDITFVPKTTYSGTVVIYYTGYNIDGKSYTGVVKITVTKEVPAADDIEISTKEDTPVTFDDEEFNDVCEDLTGEELDYVTFTLPSSSYGKLYYNYTSPTKYDSEVSSSKKYYYDGSPYISKITFMPYKDYYGTVTIKYTGYNVDGVSFTGSVKVEVISMPETEGSLYFKDVTTTYSWAASYIDYLFEKGIVNGTGNNNYSPSSNVTRGDFMLMLYRALKLSGTDRGNFSDVPKDSYYYRAIAIAKSLGIAKGYGDNFMPQAGITREDAMVLVDRALTTIGKKLTAGKASDLSAFKDRNSVSDYAVTSVATLVKAGIIQGSNSYLYPKSMISRAEMAVILYKVLQLDL